MPGVSNGHFLFTGPVILIYIYSNNDLIPKKKEKFLFLSSNHRSLFTSLPREILLCSMSILLNIRLPVGDSNVKEAESCGMVVKSLRVAKTLPKRFVHPSLPGLSDCRHVTLDYFTGLHQYDVTVNTHVFFYPKGDGYSSTLNSSTGTASKRSLESFFLQP